MRRIMITILAVALVAISAGAALSETADEYVEKAKALQKEGKLDEAAALLEKAAAEYPKNPEIKAFLGFYTGMKAGQTKNYMEAGELANRSFDLLDEAVALGPENLVARLYRGLIYVNVPEFFNKMDTGVADLEAVEASFEDDSGGMEPEDKIMTWNLLGTAYGKRGEFEKAEAALKKITALVPGSEQAAAAEKAIAGLKNKAETAKKKEAEAAAKIDTEGAKKEILKGKKLYDEGDYSGAFEIFRKAAEMDPESPKAYKWLGLSMARLAEHGYDSRISKDTDLRTNQVMESMKYLDKAVGLAPDDVDLRFLRGSMGVYFPFFVGKREQSIEDLELVLKKDIPDSLKAQAMYLLGIAHQRKGMSYWIDTAVKYPKSGAAEMVYDEMNPGVKKFDPSKVETPCLVIDFVLGFIDELPPQTAIWIEDEDGEYVNTVYVSGFSGHVKDTQVVLPVWAAISKFRNVDAVTSASIDVGHHIYTWDLRGIDGKRVPRGEYTVKVEVSHWPSMKYQLAETVIEVGRKPDRKIVEEGHFIPYLEVRYLP